MNLKQREELAKYCFDISKLSMGSLVFSLFTQEINIVQVGYAIFGLTFGVIMLRMGLGLLKE